MNYLLDTNVVSELVASQPYQPVLDWLDAQEANSMYLSVITVGELQKGVARLPLSRRKTALEAWLRDDLLARFHGRILQFDVAASLTWGNLVGQLAQGGRPLPALDSMIAALAQHHHCTLVTRNAADFEGTGVPTLNPWSRPDS